MYSRHPSPWIDKNIFKIKTKYEYTYFIKCVLKSFFKISKVRISKIGFFRILGKFPGKSENFGNFPENFIK